MTGFADFSHFAEIDAIGENRGYTFCDSVTFGSKECFYALKIDNKDVMWYNKQKATGGLFALKLIIAEKPALVSAIADALDGPRKSLQGSTYMTVGDYTLISVFGHLLELKEPEDYDEC